MNKKPIILKIGGSVITDKNGELAARTETINRLVEEIKKAKLSNLLLVHGGGSFGHPIAKKYDIKDGLKQDSQKVGFAETHHVMSVLNGLVMDSLLWHNIPALSITPSSCIITKNGRISFFEEKILKMLMTMDIIPVLYGDAVLDDHLGFTILSGDQIVAYLARSFGADRIIIGVDVDGLFDSDPKEIKNSKLYSKINLEELIKIKNSISTSTTLDVTGGMVGKINELSSAIEKNIPVSIINANKPDRLYQALIGAKVEGTLIEKE